MELIPESVFQDDYNDIHGYRIIWDLHCRALGDPGPRILTVLYTLRHSLIAFNCSQQLLGLSKVQRVNTVTQCEGKELKLKFRA